MVTESHRRRVAVLVFAFEAALAGCVDGASAQTLPYPLSGPYAAPVPFTQASATPDASAATQDGWLIQPLVTASEVYSDNITLQPSGRERSDFVTTIQPSLIVDRHGPSLDAHIDYSPEALIYANGTSTNTIRNFLDATATGTLIRDLLYFDALGEVSQQSILPLGNQQTNSVTASGNTAETRVFGFGPFLHGRLGRDGSYTLGYRITRSDSSGNVLARNTLNDVYGQTDAATPMENLRWALDYDRAERNYTGLQSTRLSHLTGTLSYVVDPWVTLRAGAGYDSDQYPTFTPQKLAGPIYLAGFSLTPSPTTSLSVDAAHHYYGPTANIEFLHRTLSTVWRLGYSDSRTSSVQLLSAPATNENFALINDFFQSEFPNASARAIATQEFLQQAILPSAQFNDIGFLTNDYFLRKALSASLALVGAQNTVTFSAYRTVQEALANQLIPTTVFTPFQNFRGREFDLSWNHQLGPVTSATLLAQEIHNELITISGETRERVLSASLQRQFGRDLSGILTFRNIHQDSTVTNAFVENELIASVRLLF